MSRKAFLTAVLVFVALVCVSALAQDPMHDPKWSREVKFASAVRAGSVVMPVGEYRIKHEMEAQKHIMVFTRVGKWDKYRVECNMQRMPEKALASEQFVKPIAGGEQELVALTFKGEDIKHVF
ncbi:MAG TPA: hypothetical protein VN622_01060 [Clostridia bacterium]|nr:hypothetical protein [Clostridia bacterium]